jgi:hypothetical protein
MTDNHADNRKFGMNKIVLFTILIVGLQIGAARACETDLSIVANLGNGQIIKLDDGSVWKIDSADSIDSQLWSVGDDIVACDDKLVHPDDGEEVEATRVK